MTQRKRIRYIINPEDDSAMEQFIDRLQFLGIQTINMKSFDKYKCFESTWDDTENPELLLKNSRNAGAKQKELNYNGKPVPCSSVFLLKSQKKLSSTQIANLFDVSESTISRRIKKHTEDGNFHEKSKVIF